MDGVKGGGYAKWYPTVSIGGEVAKPRNIPRMPVLYRSQGNRDFGVDIDGTDTRCRDSASNPWRCVALCLTAGWLAARVEGISRTIYLGLKPVCRSREIHIGHLSMSSFVTHK